MTKTLRSDRATATSKIAGFNYWNPPHNFELDVPQDQRPKV